MHWSLSVLPFPERLLRLHSPRRRRGWWWWWWGWWWWWWWYSPSLTNQCDTMWISPLVIIIIIVVVVIIVIITKFPSENATLAYGLCHGIQSFWQTQMVSCMYWKSKPHTYGHGYGGHMADCIGHILYISIAKTNMGILINDDLDGGFKYCLFQPNKW